MWTAAAIYEEAARQGFNDQQRLRIVGASWQHPGRLETIQGDLNASAMTKNWVIVGIFREATGRELQVSSEPANAEAGYRCCRHPACPDHGKTSTPFERNNVTASERVFAAVRRANVPFTVHVSSSVVNSVADDDYTNTKRAQERMFLESGLPGPPAASRDAMNRILSLIAAHNAGSFLAVLKTFGTGRRRVFFRSRGQEPRWRSAFRNAASRRASSSAKWKLSSSTMAGRSIPRRTG